MPEPLRLTASQISTWRKCHRLHDYKYVRLYRPVLDAAPLRFGTRTHGRIAALWRSLNAGMGLGFDDTARGENGFDDEKLDALVEGWSALVFTRDSCRGEKGYYTPIAIEAPFDVQLVDPQCDLRRVAGVRLTGKIDAILQDGQGRRWVYELKTTAGAIAGDDAPYWDKLATDSQLSAYVLGAESLGYEIEGCVYDVIRKPGQRPLGITKTRSVPEIPEEYGERIKVAIKEEPEAFYQRKPVARMESQIEAFLLDAVQIAREIKQSAKIGSPRNPSACFEFGRCPFFQVCWEGDVLEESANFRRARAVHEELEAEEESE
jgi:hypothetical protein